MSQSEYRVRWQREGLRPKTRIFQRRQAAERLMLVLEGRLAEVTGLDPDDYACCSGFECACYGASNAQVWAKERAALPPLVQGPELQERNVAPWATVNERRAA